MFLLLTLLGCPANPGEDDSVPESTCPDGALGEEDIGCTCGGDILDDFYACRVASCQVDVLTVDDGACCKAVSTRQTPSPRVPVPG